MYCSCLASEHLRSPNLTSLDGTTGQRETTQKAPPSVFTGQGICSSRAIVGTLVKTRFSPGAHVAICEPLAYSRTMLPDHRSVDIETEGYQLQAGYNFCGSVEKGTGRDKTRDETSDDQAPFTS